MHSPVGSRIPASERTSQKLEELLSQGMSDGDASTELLTLAARKIVEEALAAKVAEALAPEYYEDGAVPGEGYRNGYRRCPPNQAAHLDTECITASIIQQPWDLDPGNSMRPSTRRAMIDHQEQGQKIMTSRSSRTGTAGDRAGLRARLTDRPRDAARFCRLHRPSVFLLDPR